MNENPLEEPAVASETAPSAPSPIDELGLDDATLDRVKELLNDAEAEGYLRGRNEKISTTQHFRPLDEAEPQAASFPHYNRPSVWERG